MSLKHSTGKVSTQTDQPHLLYRLVLEPFVRWVGDPSEERVNSECVQVIDRQVKTVPDTGQIASTFILEQQISALKESGESEIPNRWTIRL